MKYKEKTLRELIKLSTKEQSKNEILKESLNEAENDNKSKPMLGEVCWTLNTTYLPVQVEILELDSDNRMARINQGWISYDRLYESEDKCPQR